MPVELEPAEVTSRGVFHASFHPGGLLPPQKYGTRPTKDSATRMSSLRVSLQVRLARYAFSSASVMGGIIPFSNEPYMVIFNALDILRMASPVVIWN